jgi:NAD(P)-dependent dehydrogenase (short-subunit alcohol dehydrogenase family)
MAEWSNADGPYAGKVAWVTGGANGIGAATVRRLARGGAKVLVSDVDEARGAALAAEIGGAFVRCDVADPADSLAAVALAVDRFGGLDLAFLNAGVMTGFDLEDGFSPEAYRRVMGINLDGVVFGVHAALPALRARGGGDIVATASMAGLTATPFDPIYGTNKSAVVGLVRSLGPRYVSAGIRLNAICPSFADTAIIATIKSTLAGNRVPLVEVEAIVDTVVAILAGDGSGECWFVQAGREPAPFGFRNVPGPRTPDGRPAGASDPHRPLGDLGIATDTGATKES